MPTATQPGRKGLRRAGPALALLALVASLAAVAMVAGAGSAQAMCQNGALAAPSWDTGGLPVALASPIPQPQCGGGAPPSTTISFSKSGTQSVILCTASIDDPHKSTHVPGTANVESHINCGPTALMSYMSLDTKIWRGGVLANSGHSQISGMYWLDGNAATTCYSGSYEGTAHAYLVPPAGYSPASAVADLESGVVPVSC